MNRHPILYSLLFVFIAFFVIFALFVAVMIMAPSGQKGLGLFAHGDVAVIEITGAIMDSAAVMEELNYFKESDRVKAIVLRIDSPGGAVAPSQEIFEEVKKLKPAKKIVVSMGTLAASGGYYIAVAGDKILASPGTITGSIGVIMETMGLQQLMEKVHLESRVIKSGAYKDVGSPLREMTPEERAYLQSIIDNMYGQFKAAVAEGRKIPVEKVQELAQGKIYTGQQALEAGLIDQLGTLYDAIDEAKKLAGLPDDAKVIWPYKEESFLQELFQSKAAEGLLGELAKKYFPAFDFPMGFYYMDLQPAR